MAININISNILDENGSQRLRNKVFLDIMFYTGRRGKILRNMKRMAIVLTTDCQGRGYIAHHDTKNHKGSEVSTLYLIIYYSDVYIA